VKSVGWIETWVGKLIGDPVYRMLLEHILAHAVVLAALIGMSVAIEKLTHRVFDPCSNWYAFLGFHLLESVGLALKGFVVYVVFILIVDQGANIFRRFWARLFGKLN
jgi:hypothetical protein